MRRAAGRELMGWRRKNDSGRYLVIPCRGIDGEILGYRCKPPVVRNGAYLQPAGARSFAYCLGWDDGPHRYVVICEGEKKALAVHQVTGQPTIGLAGIWNWGKKDGKVRRLIPPLQKIEWGGRKTIILFDTDAVLKTAVLHAAAELARVLTASRCDHAYPLAATGPRGRRDAIEVGRGRLSVRERP